MSVTRDIIDDLIREVTPEGSSPYPELLQNARDKNFHGIAVNSAPGTKTYFMFINGYPEGAVLADSKGECTATRRFTKSRGVTGSSSTL